MYTFLTDIADPFVSHLEYEGITQDPVLFVTAQVTCGNEVVGSISSVDFEIIDDDHVDVTFYGLQSIIAGYMKSNNRTISTFDIEYTIGFERGAGTVDESLDILYNRFKITGTTAQMLLTNRFLMSSDYVIAPVNNQLILPHYFPSGRTIVKIRVYAQVDNGIDYNEWNYPINMPAAGMGNVVFVPSDYIQEGFENYLYWEVRYPNASQVFTVYPLRDNYSHRILFRNRFNIQTTVYILGAHTTEQSKEYESGVINDKLVPYDIERIITHTLSADAVSPQLIPYLREIAISEDVAIDGEPIIVTEYDIPSSDELNASTAFSLSYQPQTKNGIDKL